MAGRGLATSALVLCLFTTSAQQGDHLTELPDTVPWHPLTISLLPVGGTALDGYPRTLLSEERWHGCVGTPGSLCQWRIGWDTDSGTVVLDPMEADLLVTDHQEVEELDLDSDGDLELVLRWEEHLGHTGWEHAIHERDRGVAIVDPELGRGIMIWTHASLEEWGTEYAEAPDTADYADREVLSTWSDGWCEERQVTTDSGQLLIGPVTACDTTSGGMRPFTLTESGLVRLP